MTSRRLRIAAVLVALACALPLLGTAHAQSSDERIVYYIVEITIESAGSMLVRERIAYDFGTNDRHGIVRDVVVRQRYDDRYDRLYAFELRSVTAESPSTPTNVDVEEPGGGLARIRIGDADRTIRGIHVYVIEYRLSGTLNAFEGHDELYWNAIGPGWSVPVGHASVIVTGPAEVLDAACFAGPRGSSRSCDGITTAGSRATFDEANLPEDGAVTVVVALPKGAVPEPAPLLEERWSIERAFTIDPLRLGLTGALLALVVLGVGRMVWVSGRDRHWRDHPVAALPAPEGATEARVPLLGAPPYPVEYTPPEGMRPGLAGTLLDEVAHPLDVTATIVDLATRGYLRVEEIPKRGWFGREDWRLIRLKPSEGLEPCEAELLDGLFRDDDEVLLSDLRTAFAPRLQKVQQALYADIVRRGWYARSPQATRSLWLGVGIFIFVGAIGVSVLAIAATTFALVPLPLILGGVLLTALHGRMPHRTARGTAAYRRALGFRRFILDAERYRARFAEQAGLFYDYLPYAVVFGATKQWAKAFEGLDLQQPDWYAGTRPLTALAIADAMGGFAERSVGAISSTPGGSGSSGFSGGSSGGGGGGGGGGSW